MEDFFQDDMLIASVVSYEKRPATPFGFLKGAPAKQVRIEDLSQDDVIIASVASRRHCFVLIDSQCF